jgi:hypothetical protein
LIPENIHIYQFPEKICMNGPAKTSVRRGRPVVGKRMAEKMMGGIKGDD